MKHRVEHDLLGEIRVPEAALWGAHTQRALENFPTTGRKLDEKFVAAYAAVKKACATANYETAAIEKRLLDAMVFACNEIMTGKYREHIVVEPLAGGAGTSLNMNFNELIANIANLQLGGIAGEYAPIHPLDTVNLHQSTNDTFPTALRIAALWHLSDLEQAITKLQALLQEGERKFAHVVVVGRTQLQDAVPMTMGQVFSSWAEAISRDRWRVFKCVERIKIVNLGGTATGTGVGATRRFIFRVIEILRAQTSLPLSRAENPVEATSNQDALVEVSGILSALATNILKLSNDLRIYSSTPFSEIHLPPMQAGSTIMPAKVNPVIPEYCSQLAILVIQEHAALCSAIGAGNLQLSQFFPLAAYILCDELSLLTNCCNVLSRKVFATIEIDDARCTEHLHSSFAMAAYLVPHIGYESVQKAILLAKNGMPILDAFRECGATEDLIAKVLSPSNLLKLGE